MRISRRPWALLQPSALLLLLPVFTTGCLTHKHYVLKTRRPDVVQNATLDQVLQQVDDRYKLLQSMTAIVRISTATGSNLKGVVEESVDFKGAIILQNPEQIRVILNDPILGSRILDMVSDGKSFKMLIPPKDCAISGSDVVTNPSQKGMYALRPGVILDSILIRGLEPDQIVSRTQDSRTFENPKKKNDFIEEPDYDLELLSSPKSQVARTIRVIHIGRTTMLPYRQDIYDTDGNVVTQASYSNYKKFGDINFPSTIVIKRPLDELSLTITVTKATFNQTLPEDQFKLDIPDKLAHLANMDDPAIASIKNPCVASAQQSPH
jgi:outer membrane lipoprotein-sorting protein